jgi:hypothetical protein
VRTSRVGYRPEGEGRARLEVAAVERPALTPWRSVLLRMAVGAVSDQQLAADVIGLARTGDTLQLAGHWQPHRAGAQLSASAPRALGLPGIVTVQALWDEQSYRTPADAEVAVERRRRVSAALADWFAADTHVTWTLAGDEWQGRGSYGSLSMEVDQRFLRDHVSLGGSAAGWWRGGAGAFYAASARLAARSRAAGDGPAARIDASYEVASARAPFAVWAGAGTGSGRAALLRAHPLLHDGVLDGAAFGRALWRASGEADAPIGRVGPIVLRGAAFADSAVVSAPSRRSFVDVGAGIRLRPPGGHGTLRIDLATPAARLGPCLSVGWQSRWPTER